jgi:hypothetical protein
MDAIGHHARVTLARLDRGEKLITKIDYPVQTWAFGDSLAMVHLPGELVVDYALRLKRGTRRPAALGHRLREQQPVLHPQRAGAEGGRLRGRRGDDLLRRAGAVQAGPRRPDRRAVKEQIGKQFGPKFDPKKTGDTRRCRRSSRSPRSDEAGAARRSRRRRAAGRRPGRHRLRPGRQALGRGDGRLPARQDGQVRPRRPRRVPRRHDGDGFFDTSTVFLDNLPFPTGVLPWRKGRARLRRPGHPLRRGHDRRRQGRQGREALQRLRHRELPGRVNSLQYGLDGWVYGSCGLFGGNIKSARRARRWRSATATSASSRTRANSNRRPAARQQGRVRDDRGNWFGCDNSNLVCTTPSKTTTCGATRTSPTRTPWSTPSRRTAVLAQVRRPAVRPLRPAEHRHRGLRAGIYRDDLLGKEYTGNAFTCEPVNLARHTGASSTRRARRSRPSAPPTRRRASSWPRPTTGSARCTSPPARTARCGSRTCTAT